VGCPAANCDAARATCGATATPHNPSSMRLKRSVLAPARSSSASRRRAASIRIDRGASLVRHERLESARPLRSPWLQRRVGSPPIALPFEVDKKMNHRCRSGPVQLVWEESMGDRLKDKVALVSGAAQVVQVGAPVRRRRCSSPAKEQRCSPTLTSMPPSRGSLHLICSDQSWHHSVHSRHRTPVRRSASARIRSCRMMSMPIADSPCRGHRCVWRQRRRDIPPA
jgi:hypothetical protein